MAGEVMQVGERTYRERFGRYCEDFQAGDLYEHRPGRTAKHSAGSDLEARANY